MFLHVSCIISVEKTSFVVGMELSELAKARSFEPNEAVRCFMAPLSPTELLALFLYSSVLFQRLFCSAVAKALKHGPTFMI